MIRSLLIAGLIGVIPATTFAAEYRTRTAPQGGNRQTLVRVRTDLPRQQAPYALTATDREQREVGELRATRVTQGGSRSTIILAPADHPAE